MRFNNNMDHPIEPNRCYAKLISNQKKQCSRKKVVGCNFCGIHQRIWEDRGLNTIGTQVNKQYIHRIHNNGVVIKIQKLFRGGAIRKNIKLRGVSVYARHLCTNATDCYELDDIETIPLKEFISYSDSENLHWGFYTKTLRKLLKYDSPNPYNLKDLPQNIKTSLKGLKFNKPICKPKRESPQKYIQQYCIEVFQKIDSLNNYTKCSWFLNLNIREMKNLYYFILDLWEYRLNLSIQDKKKYINNMPLFHIKYADLKTYTDYHQIARIILNIFNRLVTDGEHASDRTTACNWILSALTLVSMDARSAFPWLYQAAHPTLNI